jgi:flagellin-like protein
MRLTRRRGVSEVVGELLLLAITVALGLAVFSVGSTTLSGTSNGFSLLFGHGAQAAEEIYTIEYVQFGAGPPANVTVTVRNVGFIEADVADVALFNLTDTTGQQSGVFPASGIPPSDLSGGCSQADGVVQVLVGNFCSITVPFDWGAGTVYTVAVSTSRGNSVEGQFEG